MTEPSIYPHITDDGSPNASAFEPVISDQFIYIRVDGSELYGLFVLVAQNSICWEVHTCLLPCAYGAVARSAAHAMAAWAWDNTPAMRLVTTVPACNGLALRFAMAAGMTQYATNPKSFAKNGTLWDQALLGMSRPEEEKCQQQ